MNEMYLRRKEAMLHPVYKIASHHLPFWLDTAPLGTNASTYHPPGEFESCVFPTVIAFREKRAKSSTDVVSGVPHPSMYE
jgi:hypothetical protein